MKKAIFIGYKADEHAFNFTKGNEYIVKQGCNYEYITDDHGYDVSPFNRALSRIYEFSVSESEALCDPTNETARFKYFINGSLVTKGCFYESLGELNEAEKLGAKVSSIKFEIKFE